jgi:acyl-CoA hydrolase
MDHIDFIQPVHLGDLVTLKSSVNRAFTTSMEVGVKVWAENTQTGECMRHVASAYLVFVAIDKEGRRQKVPELMPETPTRFAAMPMRCCAASIARRSARRKQERLVTAAKESATAANPDRKQSINEVEEKRIFKRKKGATNDGAFTCHAFARGFAGRLKDRRHRFRQGRRGQNHRRRQPGHCALAAGPARGPDRRRHLRPQRAADDGLDAAAAVGPDNRIEPNLTHGIKTISIGYISPGDKPLVMRGPMLHQIIRQFLQQVDWGELDYLIVDLPPGTGDVVISLVQTVPLTGAVVVSTPSDVACRTRARPWRCSRRSTSRCWASSRT